MAPRNRSPSRRSKPKPATLSIRITSIFLERMRKQTQLLESVGVQFPESSHQFIVRSHGDREGVNAMYGIANSPLLAAFYGEPYTPTEVQLESEHDAGLFLAFSKWVQQFNVPRYSVVNTSDIYELITCIKSKSRIKKKVPALHYEKSSEHLTSTYLISTRSGYYTRVSPRLRI